MEGVKLWAVSSAAELTKSGLAIGLQLPSPKVNGARRWLRFGPDATCFQVVLKDTAR